jgi:hypothetical protein
MYKFFVRNKRIWGVKLVEDVIMGLSEFSNLSNIFISKRRSVGDKTVCISYYNYKDAIDYTRDIEKKIGPTGINLLLKMLDNNTLTRISSENILKHPFLNTDIFKINTKEIKQTYYLNIENYIHKFLDFSYSHEFINYHKNITISLKNNIGKYTDYLFTKSNNLEYYDSCINTIIILKSIDTTENIQSIMESTFTFYNSIFAADKKIISDNFYTNISYCENIISVYGCIMYLIVSINNSIPMYLAPKSCSDLLELTKLNVFYMISVLTGEYLLYDVVQYSILVSLKINNSLYNNQYDTYTRTLLDNNILQNYTLTSEKYDHFKSIINLDEIFNKNG